MTCALSPGINNPVWLAGLEAPNNFVPLGLSKEVPAYWRNFICTVPFNSCVVCREFLSPWETLDAPFVSFDSCVVCREFLSRWGT